MYRREITRELKSTERKSKATAMPFQEPPPAQVQKKPPSSQESKGDNSPNIVAGDNSTITINPPSQDRNPRFREKIENITLTFGGMHFVWPVAGLATPRSPMLINKEVPFTAYMKNGTMYVDVNITNGSGPGAPSIKIVNSEFSQPPIGWDRNFDGTALEFVNEKRIPLFQMIYGSSDVTIYGVFIIGNMIFTVNESGTRQFSSMPSGPLPTPKRIFEYPSSLHRGERAK
jgi:hypothetical protein